MKATRVMTLIGLLMTQSVMADGYYAKYSYNGTTPKQHNASSGVISAIKTYERTTATANTVNADILGKCPLEARPFEIDDGKQTNEWLISTPSQCSVNKIPTHWLIQNKNNQLNVLTSARSQVVTINQARNGSKSLKGLTIRFIMRAPLPRDIDSEVINDSKILKETTLQCTHRTKWSAISPPQPDLSNDSPIVYVVDGSFDPSIVDYVARMPKEAGDHSPSIKQKMLSSKPFRCSEYY